MGPWNSTLSFPNKPVKDEALERGHADRVEEGLSALTKQLQREIALVSKLVENRFQLRGVLDESDRLVGAAQGNGRKGE